MLSPPPNLPHQGGGIYSIHKCYKKEPFFITYVNYNKQDVINLYWAKL